jgi:capsular polysaccharide biosynthesis protein
LTELSFYGTGSSFQEAMKRLRLPPQSEAPRHLPGDAAVIASRHAGWNYFHWLINAVPRFELLRRAGLPPELAA